MKASSFFPLAGLLLLLACCSSPGNKAEKEGRLTPTEAYNEVEVITLARTDFHRQLLSNGKLVAASRASLTFSSAGPIADIGVKNGQWVSKGTVLATVSRPDLELEVREAESALEKARMEMYDYLVGQGYPARDTLSPPEDILSAARMRSGYTSALNTLARARMNLKGTVLKAPFGGRVADIRLHSHDLSGSEPFCTLVDDSSFDVDFTVLESEYAFLSKGLPVVVTPFADASLSCKGAVTDINPLVDKNGQVLVRASVKGVMGLLDGMNVKVTVERLIPGQLVVPRSAVVIRDNLDVLFTYTDDGKAHWTYVNILYSNADSHVVVPNRDRGAQLSEGDRVIISGNLNLADGSSVTLKK